jgi:hypothetical protein
MASSRSYSLCCISICYECHLRLWLEPLTLGSQEILLTELTTGGHACYFTFIAEMKKPKDFPKALGMLQSISILAYIVAAVVMYRFGGKDIKSPALGSAGALVSKIAYGLALPTVST